MSTLTKGVFLHEVLDDRELFGFLKKILLDKKKYKFDVRMARRIWQIGMNAYFQFEDDYLERTQEHDSV